jgi:predicted porin
MAKYTFEFGGDVVGGLKDGGLKGGLKDGPIVETPPDKLTIFAGYQYVDLSNPSSPQSAYNGFTTMGGYRFITSGVRAFGTDRILQTAWTGARYETGPWSITGAYYHWDQNSFLNAAFRSCAFNNAQPIVATNGIGRQIASNCSGDYNQGSVLVDYVFNKYFDVYGGVSFTEISGGPSSGFLRTDNTTFATGVRVKW